MVRSYQDPRRSIHCILYPTVWGVEPVVFHQASWLESTGVSRTVAQEEVLTMAAPGFSVAALDLFKVGDRLRLGLRLLR